MRERKRDQEQEQTRQASQNKNIKKRPKTKLKKRKKGMQRCIFCAATGTGRQGDKGRGILREGKTERDRGREKESDYGDDDYSPFRSLVNCERVDILTGPKKCLFVVVVDANASTVVVVVVVYKLAAKVAASENEVKQEYQPGAAAEAEAEEMRRRWRRVRAVCKERAKRFGSRVVVFVVAAAAVDTI